MERYSLTHTGEQLPLTDIPQLVEASDKATFPVYNPTTREISAHGTRPQPSSQPLQHR